MATLDEISARLEGVRGQGKRRTARCPFHDDRNPSLSLREENGKILIKCHAGCTTREVLAAIGFDLKDLFTTSASRGANVKQRAGRVEDRYPYVDEASRLLFEVERKDPKGFSVRRPNGKGWISNLDGVRRVLYRLPQVIEATDVLICEGEKDCKNAFLLGFVATCNPFGAGKWKDDYSVFLRGKSVAIIQDADKAGREHAQAVAVSLRTVVKSLKVIELPNAKDLSDFMAQGGNREDLLRLIEGAPEWNLPRFEGGAVLDACKAYIQRFALLSNSQATVITLWVAHTYAFEAADATPYLHISSAAKRSGKTRLLEVLETIVWNPWLTGRATAAVLQRKIDHERPTLLLDESDSAFSSDPGYAEALRNVLNNGHRRSGKVSCCVGRGGIYESKDFLVFCAKAIAGIGALPDTVTDRSIQIRLKRKTVDEKVERFRRRDTEAEAAILRERLVPWLNSIVAPLRDARPQMPLHLTDRQEEGVEPLVAIADAAGGKWPEAARLALVDLCSEAESRDESIGTRLLADIRRVFGELNSDRISSGDLAKRLAEIETSIWPDFSAGKPLIPVRLARLLRPFDVSPHSIRIGNATPKGYLREDFADAWKRYLPAEEKVTDSEAATQSATAQQPNPDAGSGEFSTRNTNSGVAAQKHENANDNGASCVVALSDRSADLTKGGDEEDL
jgi:hypothetical protein